MVKRVSIIGAGLSGCEAALILSRNGFDVTLYDQKPSFISSSSAYKLPSFAELICNNVIAPWNPNTPLGLLLSELRSLKSPLVELAYDSGLDDNSYLSVDKKRFSQLVTESLKKAQVHVVCRQITEFPKGEIVVLATGPLTDENIIEEVSRKTGMFCFHFADATSVVVDIRSITTDTQHYSKISDDLYAVTLTKEELNSFYKLLLAGTPSTSHSDEDYTNFQACYPLEIIAQKGEKELIEKKFHNPVKPGISFLLRRENSLENGFILAGFTSRLRYEDQKRALSSIPGFENVKIIKYGRAHRNTYFDSPRFLNEFYKVNNQEIYIIGQLSGIDGYLPCISSGFVAAHRIIHGNQANPFPKETMIGALANYISNKDVTDYTPMGASFSLIHQSLTARKEYVTQSMKAIEKFVVLNK